VSSLSFFFKHSYRDVGRRKCHFCLSFCSVFIVVWAALVINTLVAKGPVIFLKLAEAETGQFDGVIYPGKLPFDFGRPSNWESVYVNYTHVQKMTKEQFNFAPRKTFCATTAGSTLPADQRARFDDEYLAKLKEPWVPTSDGKNKVPTRSQIGKTKNILYSIESCLMFMDTQRERDIASGRRYKFPTLNEGECIIHQQLAASLAAEEGDTVYLRVNMMKNLDRLVKEYNKLNPKKKIKYDKADTTVTIPCTVAHVGDQSYGKVEKLEASRFIYMEYHTLFKYMAQYLPAALDKEAGFKDFLKVNGTKLAYQLADFLIQTLPAPRVRYYESSNYYEIQRGVTQVANEAINALGFYPVRMQLLVLG